MSIFETFDPAKSLGQQVKYKRKKPTKKRTQIGLEDIQREKAQVRAQVKPPPPKRTQIGLSDVQREKAEARARVNPAPKRTQIGLEDIKREKVETRARANPAPKRTQIGLEDIQREKEEDRERERERDRRRRRRSRSRSRPSPPPAPSKPKPELAVEPPRVERALPEPITQTGLSTVVNRGTPESAPRQTRRTTVPEAPVGPTPEEIREQIAAEERASAIRNLQAAFGKTERSLGAEGEALDPMFLEQRGDIRTQDIFARRRADVSAATGGLSTSGAASQANLQQNVLTQGAMSQSRTQEADMRADIGRRLTEAEALMNQGVADAETAAEVRRLESQLKELETEQEARLEAAKLADERAYDTQVMQLKNMNDQDMVLLESQLDRNEQILDAEIQDARDNKLYQQEQSLLAQKATINAQQAAIEERLRQQTDRLESSLTLGEIAARGAQDRLTRDTEKPETPERLIGEDTYTAAIERAEDDSLSRGETPEQARVRAAEQLVNLAIREQDNMSEEMFNKLMLEYGITEADIYRATNGGL